MTWRILQKLFNLPPWEDAEFITGNSVDMYISLKNEGEK